MISESVLSQAVEGISQAILKLQPAEERFVPAAEPGQRYMLYAHIPFCESLCPYCSFNRRLFDRELAQRYCQNLRAEMLMLKELGYDFESIYFGGGTPTILIDELCQTIDLAREAFSIKEVSCETNPNHLAPEYISKLEGRVQRLSVGVQSFDDDLLKQMGRFEKYGSGREIVSRLQEATQHFPSLNADMIFNFPAQTEDILIADIERVVESGASQVTFYPLMAAPSVRRSLAETVGTVDYRREELFYRIISELLLEGPSAPFELGDAWSFNRRASWAAGAAQGRSAAAAPMIDEYVVDYEQYPAVGSGGFGFLGPNLYVNTFSVDAYNKAVESGFMSLSNKVVLSKRNRMRYRFMMQLFALRLDKKRFEEDFGCSVELALPAEMAFMRAAGAFASDTKDELTLTRKGRYLVVVMMREFFIGVNRLRDQARAELPEEERCLHTAKGCESVSGEM